MDTGFSAESLSNIDYIESIKRAVAAWRAEVPGVVSYVLGKALAPVGWLVEQLIPEAAIEGALGSFDWATKNTLTARFAPDLNDLSQCDNGADHVINFHIGVAASEGALAVFSAAGANTQAEKAAALAMTSLLMNMLAKQTWKAMAAKAAAPAFSAEAAVIAIRNLAKQLGINLTKRKSLAAIPVIGAAVGASANGWFVREIGVAAQRLYQERWLRDRDFIIDGEALTEAAQSVSAAS